MTNPYPFRLILFAVSTFSFQIPLAAYPPPTTVSSLTPYSATAGGPGFTLFLIGPNFVSGATVQWGATPLATTFESIGLPGLTFLYAQVSADLIATAGTVNITATNPGSAASAAFPFTILSPTGQTWTQLATSGGPPAGRDGASGVFDPATTQMIVFGGNGDSPLNDTWSLNTTTNQWSQLAPAGAIPPPGGGFSAVYDSVNSVMTIFGAVGSTNDVWTLSNANGMAGTPKWTQLSPTGTAPSPRSDQQAIYDPGSNRMIAFGGYSLGARFNDVWVLTSANGLAGTPSWIQLAPAGTLPIARSNMSVVYDPASNEMIVFGGFSISDTTNGVLGDVWVLSNANGIGGTPVWTQETPAGAAIPARYAHTAVYDAAFNRMIVFGGSNEHTEINDTWVLTNANNRTGTPTWIQLAPAGTIPGPKSYHTAVLDPSTNRMIIFGSSGYVNDAWALSNVNEVTPSIASLPPGWIAAGGPPFTLTVNGQSFASGAAVQWNGITLPTSFVNTEQLTAAVGSNLIAATGTAGIIVVNPDGVTSSAQTFIVSATQTVTFAPLSSVTFGVPPFALNATASSGLAVSFTSATPGVCTVSGTTVTLVSSGICSITASQAGNAVFAPAMAVTRSFAIVQPVTLAVDDGIGVAGDTVEIPIRLTYAGTPAVAAFQLDLNFDPQQLTFRSARSGAQLTVAGKNLSTNPLPNGDIRLVATGLNQNIIANGIVAYGSFTLSTPYRSSAVTPKACTSVDGQGTLIGTACTSGTIGPPIGAINGDGPANVADIQLVIDAALAVSPAVPDLNRDGVVNVADVQIVINAVLGLGCSVP